MQHALFFLLLSTLLMGCNQSSDSKGKNSRSDRYSAVASDKKVDPSYSTFKDFCQDLSDYDADTVRSLAEVSAKSYLRRDGVTDIDFATLIFVNAAAQGNLAVAQQGVNKALAANFGGISSNADKPFIGGCMRELTSNTSW